MIGYLNKEESLKKHLQQILNSRNLDSQKALISAIAAELEIDSLTCAAALVHLIQAGDLATPFTEQKTEPKPSLKIIPPGIKMVRYRLDVGSKHQITLEGIKKVLIEESGVDKNNIGNIHIHGLYTLIDLPDEMPPDIFQHLKSVEINQHKLDIRRVKKRNKKRAGPHIRRGRRPGSEVSDQVSGKA
ncbi:MAG: DbpA RNA binding domain-containing protein [Methylococcales bacterium]|nr:DbpA RNA binding domain-containing protein [Methylococcales bacterium]